MSNREKVPEYIDRYNAGELKGEELQIFNEMLKSNPRLRDEVKLDSELNEILAQTDILEFRRTILFEQKHYKKKKGPDLKSWLIAASLLLLIGIEVALVMNKDHYRSTVGPSVSNQKPLALKSLLNNKAEKQTILAETQNKAIETSGNKKDTNTNKRFRKNSSFEKMIGSTRHSGYFNMNAPGIGYSYKKMADIITKIFTPCLNIIINYLKLDSRLRGNDTEKTTSLPRRNYYNDNKKNTNC